jgi:hypothetical protein
MKVKAYVSLEGLKTWPQKRRKKSGLRGPSDVEATISGRVMEYE